MVFYSISSTLPLFFLYQTLILSSSKCLLAKPSKPHLYPNQWHQFVGIFNLQLTRTTSSGAPASQRPVSKRSVKRVSININHLQGQCNGPFQITIVRISLMGFFPPPNLHTPIRILLALNSLPNGSFMEPSLRQK